MDPKDRLTKYTAMNDVVYTLKYSGDSRNPSSISSDGVTTSYTYDAGNVTQTQSKDSDGQYLESTTGYDASKNFAVSSTDTNGASSSCSYDTAKGLLLTSTTPRKQTTSYTYNEDNGRILSSDTAGATLNYSYYDNGQTSQINRNGATKWLGYRFEYDVWGNTKQIQVGKPADGTANGLSSATTLATYSYDRAGKMTRMNYPSGQYVTYGYDKLDRLVSEVYYNSDGSIQAEYQYIYNANGQLARQQAIRDGAVTECYSFEYDSLGRLIRSREEGGSGIVQRTEHQYDKANRLTNQNWTVGTQRFSESYTYRKGDGALDSVQEATGDTVSYGYDKLKRVNSVTTKNSADSLLLTQSSTYQAGKKTNQTTARLSSYTVKGANNQTIVGNRYTYDANGNITKIEEANGSDYRVVAVYAYDSLDQLKKETRYTYNGTSNTAETTTVIAYTINKAGNLRKVTTTVNDEPTNTVTYSYSDSAWADKLTAVTINDADPVTISYADALNPENWYNGTEYTNLTWTQGRRLASITKGNDTYSYEYDMSGVRSVKIADGLRHEYVTQNGQVVRDYVTNADSGAFVRCLDFFYDPSGRPFAMRKYRDSTLSGYNTFHYVLNAQGDVVQLNYQGKQNKVYAQYSYDAWGNVLTKSGSLADVNPLRYRGYYCDTETGFYYLQSRYYDPIVKRFLNADSYGSTGQGFTGYNMFAYCLNNPAIGADPNGHRVDSVLPAWLDGGGGDVAAVGGGGGIVLLFLLKALVDNASSNKSSFVDGIPCAAPISYEVLKEEIKEKIETAVPPRYFNNQSVYIMRNINTGIVEYVGRTNDPNRRQTEHRQDRRKQGLGPLQVVKTDLTVDEARVVEQSLIMAYGLRQLRNRRREISARKGTAFYDIASYIGKLEFGFWEDELREMLN